METLAITLILLVAANLVLTAVGIKIIIRKENTTMATVADLQAEVAALTTVDQSVVTLLDGLSAQLKAAQNDPSALQQVINDLDAQKTALADAVARNTPAANHKE